MCKVFASEALWRTVNHAVQIAGGNGYMSEYPFERVLRDSRINLIFEGTNEILRHYLATAGVKGLVQARGGRAGAAPDALQRVHPALAEEAAPIQEDTSRFASAVEEVLSTHGKDFPRHEHQQERLANVAMDLYAMLATLSRTTGRLESVGESGARRELLLTRLFCRQARRRIGAQLNMLRDNDDPLVNEAADIAYRDGGYTLP